MRRARRHLAAVLAGLLLWQAPVGAQGKGAAVLASAHRARLNISSRLLMLATTVMDDFGAHIYLS